MFNPAASKAWFDSLPAVKADPKFDAWMAKVDAAIGKKCGLSSSDLADIDYLSMFEDGESPSAAAKAALSNEGWEG